jgi:DNA-binding Lrp family transcriptional regulator
MSAQTDDWQTGLDATDQALIDGFQSGFPLEPNPFETVGQALGTTPADAFERLEQLMQGGIVRRFGAVLNPPVIGSSTLAAVQAPEGRFDDIAAVINGYEQVNHNYRRKHTWNMWFVVTAATQDRRDEILAEIEERTGCAVLNLPMLTDYYIDLEFPVVNDDRVAREGVTETDVSATRISEDAIGSLTDRERSVILGIQDGFPMSMTPYAEIGDRLGLGSEEVTEIISGLIEKRCIKRVGCVINHITTGFTANCMVVWDVPDPALDERGEQVGRLPYVTLCYHRPRRPEQGWQYNLFTMVHGREAAFVDAKIDELATEHLPYPHERLYSEEKLKQTGARYRALLDE